MSDAERMYAIKETARKIVDTIQGEDIVFINGIQFRALELGAIKGMKRADLAELVGHLREKPEDVVRIVEVILESMS